jgi:hypothetical protein
VAWDGLRSNPLGNTCKNAKNLVTVFGEGLLDAITGVCDQFSPKLLYLKERLFGLNLVACNVQQIIWPHNPKVVGSNPAPATTYKPLIQLKN